MSIEYFLEKMITQDNNHTIEERKGYAKDIKEAISELDIFKEEKNYIITILNRIIDRTDNTNLDISIYTSYIENLFKEEDYQALYNSLKEYFAKV